MKYDLIDFKDDIYSQFGEDGILEKIFEELDIKNGYFIEFGAGNGIYLSNTRYLYEKGWSGLMIEADNNLYESLEKAYSNTDKVKTLQAFVSLEENRLDNILKNNNVKEIDFMSIDIDGNDYHIWDSLKRYFPKVIIIETNFTFPLNVEYIQKYGEYIGNSPLAIYNLGKSKGYSLVAQNEANSFFVRNDLYPKIKNKLGNTSFAYLSVIGIGFAGLMASDYNDCWHSMLNCMSIWGGNLYITPNDSSLENRAQKFNLLDRNELKKLYNQQD